MSDMVNTPPGTTACICSAGASLPRRRRCRFRRRFVVLDVCFSLTTTTAPTVLLAVAPASFFGVGNASCFSNGISSGSSSPASTTVAFAALVPWLWLTSSPVDAVWWEARRLDFFFLRCGSEVVVAALPAAAAAVVIVVVVVVGIFAEACVFVLDVVDPTKMDSVLVSSLSLKWRCLNRSAGDPTPWRDDFRRGVRDAQRRGPWRLPLVGLRPCSARCCASRFVFAVTLGSAFVNASMATTLPDRRPLQWQLQFLQHQTIALPTTNTSCTTAGTSAREIMIHVTHAGNCSHPWTG